MQLSIYDTVDEMGKAAAAKAAYELSRCIAQKGSATFMAATGSSQFEFLEALTHQPGVDWSKTIMYHLDEYIGLAKSHPASFRRYLHERLISRVHPGTVHLVNGDAPDPDAECERLSRLVRRDGIDVAFVGIGENAHLGFNDPPADFDTEAAFVLVELSNSCRAQQVHEGWFRKIEEVPRRAITVTIPQIMRSACIISVVPGARKAPAVECALRRPITPTCPASILKKHPNVHLFLDSRSAGLLDRTHVEQYQTGAR